MSSSAEAGVLGPELVTESSTAMAKTPTPEPENEYTIDQLAALSRVPSRTIRFYQSAGALPKPQIRGRVAFYGPAHAERLKLVADLQDRGLRMKAICDLLGKVDQGELDLNEWLGLERQLGAPWAEDSPRVVEEAELYALIGGRRSGVLAELVRLRLVERQGDSFLVRSPGVLGVAMRLEAAGIDLDTVSGAIQIIRKNAAKAARDLGEYFLKHAQAGFGREAGAEDLRMAYEELRPASQDALRLIFGMEMAGVLREQVESGKVAALRGKKPRKTPRD
jgi:DNA-binding transcriptional MerR regulator